MNYNNSPKELRTKYIMIRVSYREKKLIEYKKAEANESSVAAYVRNRSLGKSLQGFRSDQVSSEILILINNTLRKIQSRSITESDLLDVFRKIKNKIHGT